MECCPWFNPKYTACAKTWTMDWTMDDGLDDGRWTSIVQVLAFVLKPGRWTIFI
jgi:hypothetical protein